MNALQVATGAAVEILKNYTQEQLDLVKRTICKGATDDELKMFLYQAHKAQLDPFAKQIYSVARYDGKAGREVRTTQVGIDGFRLIAERTGKYEGQHGPFWCGKDGAWKDVWTEDEPPFAAKVGVWKTGAREPTWGVALWREYVQTYKDKQGNVQPTGMWAKMKANQLAKCFDDKTEVLTNQGYFLFKDVPRSAKIMMLTPEGLVPTSARPWSQEYSGDMVTLDSDDLNFCVTPNHQMVTTMGRLDASVMYELSRYRPAFYIPRLTGSSSQGSGLSRHAIVLAAAFLCDGFKTSGRAFSIKVSRKKKIDMLQALGGYESASMVRAKGAEYDAGTRIIRTNFDYIKFNYALNSLAGICSHEKVVDLEKLCLFSREEAREFVDTMVFFDGSANKKTGVRRFYSSNPLIMQAFELACALGGYAVSPRTYRDSDIGTKPGMYLTISGRDAIGVTRKDGSRGASPKPMLKLTKNESGIVWCVTVPSSTIVVRRRGFSMICGNCSEALALRKAFPMELSGLYLEEEMEQAGPDLDPEIPPAADGSLLKTQEQQQIDKQGLIDMILKTSTDKTSAKGVTANQKGAWMRAHWKLTLEQIKSPGTTVAQVQEVWDRVKAAPVLVMEAEVLPAEKGGSNG